MVPMKTISAGGAAGKVMQAINVPVSTIIPSAYEGQQIQIVNANGSTIGTVQGVLQGGSSQVQTIQLQVVDAPPPPPPTKIARLKANDEDNWKFIQVAEDGQTTTYIQQKWEGVSIVQALLIHQSNNKYMFICLSSFF